MKKQGIRILHLEDNILDAELVSEALLRAGIQCIIDQVRTKERFIGALKDVPYDLIISDFSMPGFDGESALSISRDLQPDLSFIFYSGTPHDDARLERLRRHAKDIIPKGMLDDLVWAVRKSTSSDRRATKDLPLDQWNREAQKFLDFLVTESSDGILVFDENRLITYWNQAMEGIYGLSPEDVLGKPLIDILMKVKRNGEDLLLYKLVQGSPCASQECSHVNQKTRTVIYTETHYWPLRGVNNANTGGIVLVRNITARKRLEKTRQQVDAAFHNLFNRAALGLFVTDCKGRFLYTNQKMRRMIRLSSEEVAGKNIRDLLSEEGQKTWDMVVEGLPATGETEMECLMSRNNDGLFEADLSLSLVSSNQILVAVRDNSDRVSREHALRSSEESFRSLGEYAGDVVFSVLPDSRVGFLSTTFSRITGWSKFVWIGNDLLPLIHPDDTRLLQYTINCVLAGRSVRPFRLRIRRTDGTYFAGECSCSPLFQRSAIAGVWSIVREIEETPVFESHVNHELN